MRRKQTIYMLLFFYVFLVSGCSNDTKHDNYPTEYPASQSYAIDELLLADSPGTAVMEDNAQQVQIDFSNVQSGYIRVKRRIQNEKKMKVQIINHDASLPDNRTFAYYDLNTVNEYETFPLVYGNGNYSIVVYQNTTDKKYMNIYEGKFQVALQNAQDPFLYPNQVVNYQADSKAITLAFELCTGLRDDLSRVKVLYDYVVEHIAYDKEKAEATQNTYVLPVIDETLASEKGICFDYAALLAAMCRSQHIPCKVVVGNTSIEYHAWVEVWLEGQGWINPEVLFEADSWSRADPTFAASKTEYEDYYETIYEY